MLWQKELKRVDSLYVDLLCDFSDDSFTDFSDSRDDSTVSQMPAKSNRLSKQYQQKAAAQCESKNWFEAIELLNEALCFAKCDSIEWVSTLTDRSTCFFQLKMYDKCLVDAKLAKAKAAAQMFMPKLNRLMAMCAQKKHQRGSNEQLVHQFKPTLSFDASNEIPFATNAIGIEKKMKKKKKNNTATTKCERFFQAKRPIEVGKTILIEDGFVATTVERYKRCCICMKSATNLIPCNECTNSLFCFGTCEREARDLHRVECNETITSSKDDDNNADLVIRSILMAFRIIPTVDEMLCFVEKVLFDKQYDALADVGTTARSKYAIFLKNGQKMLHMADTEDSNDDYIYVIRDIYKVLMDNDDFSGRFELPDHRRFLSHLIGQHMCALRYPKVNVEIGENDGTIVYPLFADFFAHSCYPNVALVTSNRAIVAVTIRPIEKNEPLTISYLRDFTFEDIGCARQMWLRENFNVRCDCERCVEQAHPEKNYNVQSKHGLSHQFYDDCENESHFEQKMQKMRKKLTTECVKYLNANGRDQWNDDTSLATSTYIRLLREKYYLNLQH